MSYNHIGSLNIAIGANSMIGNQIGHFNTAIGHFSLGGKSGPSIDDSIIASDNSANSANTAVGFQSLNWNYFGTSNTAVGVNALFFNKHCDSNTAVGYYALYNNDKVADLVHYKSHDGGFCNTAIGVRADVASFNLNNATAIGYRAIVTGSNTVQLGNTKVTNVNTSGNITANAVQLSSDKRLKTNIIPIKNGLSIVMQLNPVHYYKKNSIESNDYSKKENGFIAQEIQKVLPYLVSKGSDKDKLLSVDYTSIIPVLTKAIQEQQKQIEEQQKQIDELKALVNQLLSKKK